VGQQPVEGHVELGERALLTVGGDGTPGDGQRGGQVGLLGHQVGGPVAHAAGLGQEDLGVGGHQVEQHPLVAGQPRQPRLHAVEVQAVGQALPLLATPRLQPDQPVGPLAHLLAGEQLAAREDHGLGEVDGGALVGHGELDEAVDLVAPQVDAHGPVGGGGEHVDDRAPHGDLAPVLDHLLTAVAGTDQPLHQLVAVDAGAGGDGDRLEVLDVGAEALDQGPHRGHHDLGGAVRVAQAPQGAQAAAHGLDAGADPLEGQRLPGGEDLDGVVAQVGGQVAGHPLGLGGGGHGQHHRATLGQAGEAGGDQGAGRVGHGDGGGGAAQHLGERGLVPQAVGDVGEGAGVVTGGRDGARHGSIRGG
jgi:hypothetical protein